jgi:hypothetical protein
MPYVLEIESTRKGLLVLLSNAGSHEHVNMAPGAPGKPSRIALTSVQFFAFSYDIEGHAEGKYGVEKDLVIWVKDTATGQDESISFADAVNIIQAGMSSDTEASELQAAKEAEAVAAYERRVREKQKRDALDPTGLTASISSAVTALTES